MKNPVLEKIHHDIVIRDGLPPMITFWHEDGTGIMLDRGSGWSIQGLRQYAQVFSALADELEDIQKKLT